MDFVTIEEAATVTGLSRSTLAKMRCAGTGPAFYKIGRTVRYATNDVIAWMMERRRTSTWQTPANDNDPAAERGAA